MTNVRSTSVFVFVPALWNYDLCILVLFFKICIVIICICLADYLPVCWWKLWRMWSLAGTLALWHSGTAGSCNNCHGGIENLFLEINIHILPSSSCVVTMVYINIYIWCIFIVFHKPYLLTCDILSTPIPIQLLRGPSEQPELEWCSLKPQNLRVLSQLQSCWRLIELTTHSWTSCLYRITSHSHWGTYIITGTGSIPLRRSFIQQAILCIYSQVAKKEWM